MNATLSSATARDVLAGALNDIEEHVLEAMPRGAPLLRELLRQGDAALLYIDGEIDDDLVEAPEPDVSVHARGLVADVAAAALRLYAPRRWTRPHDSFAERYHALAAKQRALLGYVAELEAVAQRGPGGLRR